LPFCSNLAFSTLILYPDLISVSLIKSIAI
jgi:hypothetical protein